MPEFISALRASARNEYFWKVMPNVWLVDTLLQAVDLSERLRPHITEQDSLFVIRVQPEYGGWLSEATWEWLRASRTNEDFDRES